MDKETLREHLARLHQEITDAHGGDPKAQQSADDMMRDIKGLADKPADAASSGDGTLSERLEKVAVQFEADHPTLAASARRLVDLLGEVGI